MTATSAIGAVAASRRTLAWVLGAPAGLSVLLAALAPSIVEGDRALLALPTVLHGALVIATVLVAAHLRTDLRVDGLLLLTAWELLRGCIAPVILMSVGPATSGFFYHLGTWDDARTVLFLGNAFFAVVVGTRVVVALASERPALPATGSTARTDPPLLPSRVPSSVLIGLGLVGVVLRFPTVTTVTAFFAGDVDALQSNDVVGASGLLLVSLYLRPLLTVGLVIAILERRRRSVPWWPIAMLLPVAAVFALASYGLNRGTVAYAAIATVLVLLERSQRAVRAAPAVATIGLLGAFFVAVGTLRASLWSNRSGLDTAPVDLPSMLRSVLGYAGSPLQLGVVLPTVEQSAPFGLRSFGLTLLSPIPGAPDVSRTQSGMAVYNNIAYHSFVGKDQLLPSWFEGWLSFGAVGLMATGIVVGLLLAGSDALRRSTRTMLGSYGAMLAALWVCQAGVTGAGVIEQNLLNFAITPLLLAAAGRFLTREHHRPVRAIGTPEVETPTRHQHQHEHQHQHRTTTSIRRRNP